MEFFDDVYSGTTTRFEDVVLERGIFRKPKLNKMVTERILYF